MGSDVDTLAVLLEAPERLAFRSLALNPLGDADLLIQIDWSGVSTGTEKLLWTGRMPSFPGMGYPLVPGYESIGRVIDAGRDARSRIGEWVFVPGASCYRDARGLFGGAARRLIVAGARALPIAESLGRDGILMALAATAVHAIGGGAFPDLIVGHGILGRLLARLTIACGCEAPTVWETNPLRRSGAVGYAVLDPAADERRDYRSIYDASGDVGAIDSLVGRLAKKGEIVLAGFYDKPVAFTFPPAFMREARFRVAAEFAPEDLAAVTSLLDAGAFGFDGLISHAAPAAAAAEAYPQAFADPDCLKMVLDWRAHA